MKTFIKINDIRIYKGSIKKYSPTSNNKINVYYSPSRNKVEVETFSFPSLEDRDDMMEYLDTIFL